MNPLFRRADSPTGEIIAAAIEVHRTLGPGLLESIYEWAFIHELELRGVRTVSQKEVTVRYKDAARDEPLRFDILVNDCVLVDNKAVEKVMPIHKATLLSYMKLLDIPVRLIVNFHEMKLTDGVSRLILPEANR